MTVRESHANSRRAPEQTAPAARTRNRTFGLVVVAVAVAALGFGAAGSFLAAHLTPGSPPPVVVVPSLPEETSRVASGTGPVSRQSPAVSHMLPDNGTTEQPYASATEPEAVEDLPAETTEAPFELDEIAAALSTLDTNDAGHLIVNADVRESLEAAFNAPAGPLSEAQVEDLQAMARAGLEGEAGEQAAEIIMRYHQYDTAYREVADTLENQGNLDAATSSFEQLSIIRRSHLGEELAHQLFGEEEARTRYTLESMRIEAQANLSSEEKAQQQDALRQSAPDWLVSGRSGAEPGPSAQTPR